MSELRKRLTLGARLPSRRRGRWRGRTSVALLLVAPFILVAQGRDDRPQSSSIWSEPYDGRFTFTRIRYGDAYGFRRGGGSSWAHDYPNADLHVSQILDYVSTVRPTITRTNVFTLDDDQVFRHPILYVSEPGFWTMTDVGAQNLRRYLLKGGFLIFDDFENEQWYNMEEQLHRAIPEYRFIEIGPDHPIFHSFFEIKNIYVPHPLVRVTPRYFAIFEDNDPSRQMLVLANWNADIAEYWEWSNTDWQPVDLNNEAYKLGVNYLIWGLTH